MFGLGRLVVALKDLFIAIVPYLLGKALFDLGFGIAAFVGWTVIIGAGMDLIDAQLAGMPADVAAVIALSGAGQGFQWVLSAITTRATIAAFPRLSFLGGVT